MIIWGVIDFSKQVWGEIYVHSLKVIGKIKQYPLPYSLMGQVAIS